MPIEIEAKMKLDDFAPLRRRLAELGAVHRGEVLERNIFFDTADRDLLADNQGLRLRIATDTKTARIITTLTHKGPTAKGALKQREETEFQVSSAQAAEQLLAHIGYTRWLSFQKRRESWHLADCHIELDEVPYLGRFVEIEGPTEAAIQGLRARLDLADLPTIKSSYIALLTKHLKGQRLSLVDIDFPAAQAP